MTANNEFLKGWVSEKTNPLWNLVNRGRSAPVLELYETGAMPSFREDILAAIYLLGLNSGQGYAQRRSPQPSVPRDPTDIRFSLAHTTYLITTLTSSLCSLSFASEIA